jgi:hypothetical protein
VGLVSISQQKPGARVKNPDKIRHRIYGNLFVKGSNLVRLFFTSLTEYGLGKTSEFAIERFSGLWNDWRLGISTSEVVNASDLGFNNTAYEFYVPISYRSFHKLMKIMKIREEKEVFLDYGSGMGRAIISAAKYPFRKIIGVELSPELNRIADDNIRKARKKLKCRDIQVITADAAEYLPPADVTFFFFYNPFSEEIMSRVLEKIRLSLVRTPRNITLVYVPPAGSHRSVLDSCKWLSKTEELSRPFPSGGVMRIYRNNAGGTPLIDIRP